MKQLAPSVRAINGQLIIGKDAQHFNPISRGWIGWTILHFWKQRFVYMKLVNEQLIFSTPGVSVELADSELDKFYLELCSYSRAYEEYENRKERETEILLPTGEAFTAYIQRCGFEGSETHHQFEMSLVTAISSFVIPELSIKNLKTLGAFIIDCAEEAEQDDAVFDREEGSSTS